MGDIATLERILEQKRSFIEAQALEIERLQLLCSRAADALDCFSATPYDLIAELRKEAE